MFQYWANRFHWGYVPQVEAFADCLSGRVLPAFANIDKEGEQIAAEAYRNLASGYDEEQDFGSIAEMAQDRAIAHYETMYGLRQGIINMFAVGLWHLFEQQLADFVRHAVLDHPRDLEKNPSFAETHAILRSKWGIDITRLDSYARINELRHLANCAKHGDGSSCAKLRLLRPALFQLFPHESETILGLTSLSVIAPLGGEHLYVREDDFVEYADAVKALWIELSAEVRCVGNRRPSPEPGS